jgi:diguanylate cyclase (GGDEF)-like protein/PAS domain S-box-containing protein
MTLATLLSHLRTSTPQGRLVVLALIVAGLVVFDRLPSFLQLDASGVEQWFVVGWIVSPLVAGLAALRAAAQSEGSGRQAWRYFALGCFGWMAGTISWASYGWLGAVLPFPSLADVFYIFTSLLFMIGMFHYSLPGSGGSRIQVTNFALAISSVVAIGFILYFPVLASSQLGLLKAILAFAYPALWLSTFAFGLICFALYVPSRRKISFLIILGAVSGHVVANFFYGFDILKQSYSAGTFYDTLWIAAYVLVAWAALEHRPAKAQPLRLAGRARSAAGEALIPALSLSGILLAGVAARWPHLRPEAIFLVPVMFGFAALLAIREHALFATERRLRRDAEKTARRLADSEAQLSNVLENTIEGVMVLDTQWRITYANQNAIDMLFSDRPFLGLPIWDVLSPMGDNEFYKHYCIAMERQTPVEFEAYFAPLDVWFEDRAFPTPDNLTIFFRDVTERRRLREELVRLAQRDPLTGLANRTVFAERLAAGLHSGRRDSDLILVAMDLDGLKAVNDTMGHAAGDALLKEFANRLTGVVRKGDTVARLGGDEFAIIQPGPIEADGGAGIARRINEALLTPFDIEGCKVAVAASIGIAQAPEHGTDPDDLIRKADLALYHAKQNNCDANYCIYQPDIEDRTPSRQFPRLEMRKSSTYAS